MVKAISAEDDDGNRWTVGMDEDGDLYLQIADGTFRFITFHVARWLARSITELVPPAPALTVDAIRASLAAANTEADLAQAWRDAAPTVEGMSVRDQLRCLRAFITRECAIFGDDGR